MTPLIRSAQLSATLGLALTFAMAWASPGAACVPENQPYGLIRDVHLTLGGDQGVLLCALAPEQNGPAGGRVQEFRNGAIAWSPNVAPNAFHAVYRAGMNLNVAWGVEPWSYDFFIVRWDLNGQNLGQIDVEGDQRSAQIPITAEGQYTVIFQGCDRRPLASSRCAHGWSNPISFYVNKSGYCRGYALDAEARGISNRSVCRHTGPRWESTLQEHYNWCMSAPFEHSRSEADGRASQFAECLTINNPHICTSFPCPPESWPSQPIGGPRWP